MRTALRLLAGLAVLSIIGTIVPQEPNVPQTVVAWRAGTEGPGTAVSGILDAFGAYDMYGSAVFLALLLLLFTSLTVCLAPRFRGWWRITRHSQPPRTRHLGSQEHVERISTDLSVEDSLAAARGVLADRRYRLRPGAVDDGPGPAQVAAEKGHVAREGGSLVFHVSFYVLLVGIILGQLLGFVGQRGLVEGDTFTDSRVSYWSYQPGRWFADDDHRGWSLTLDRFVVDWIRDVERAGQPTVFRSEVTVTDVDGSTRQEAFGPNDPLIIDGMKIHQLDWGYAPRIIVRQDGVVVFDDEVDATVGDDGLFRTAVKAPAATPDVGLELTLVPWAPTGPDGEPVVTGAPWDDEPLLSLQPWFGDLQLESVQNVRELDTTLLARGPAGSLRLGQTATLPEGVTVEFAELRRWSGLQFSQRPTVPLLLVGSLLLLTGLVPALYAYRRRVWVAAAADADGRTLLTVAGRAFQRSDAFAEEFTGLTRDVRRAVGGSDAPATDPDAAPATNTGQRTSASHHDADRHDQEAPT
jgi:cytochrome c biogenesis protein